MIANCVGVMRTVSSSVIVDPEFSVGQELAEEAGRLLDDDVFDQQTNARTSGIIMLCYVMFYWLRVCVWDRLTLPLQTHPEPITMNILLTLCYVMLCYVTLLAQGVCMGA